MHSILLLLLILRIIISLLRGRTGFRVREGIYCCTRFTTRPRRNCKIKMYDIIPFRSSCPARRRYRGRGCRSRNCGTAALPGRGFANRLRHAAAAAAVPRFLISALSISRSPGNVSSYRNALKRKYLCQ